MSNIDKVTTPQNGAWPYRILYWGLEWTIVGHEWTIVPGGPVTLRDASIVVRVRPSDVSSRPVRILTILDTAGVVTVLSYRGSEGIEIPAEGLLDEDQEDPS